MNSNPIEQHPLKPFLPAETKILMLGSFPPQQKRWCIDFYYPNFINDMWRIVGLAFFNNRLHFVNEEEKRFKKDEIIEFLNKKGIALYDTATAVRRLQDNASDKFLEIVTPTDVAALIEQIPLCTAIVTTGQKATETLCQLFGIEQPNIGSFTSFAFNNRHLRLYRMPSTSRAYPMNLEKKTHFYRKMWEEVDLL